MSTPKSIYIRRLPIGHSRNRSGSLLACLTGQVFRFFAVIKALAAAAIAVITIRSQWITDLGRSGSLDTVILWPYVAVFEYALSPSENLRSLYRGPSFHQCTTPIRTNRCS